MARWLTESKQALKDLQSKHVVLRENHLATLAEARFLARKPSILEPGRIHLLSKRIETEIKCIRKRERIRHLHKLIGQALAPSNHSNGLQRVNIPATKTDTPYPAGPDPKTLDGPWRSITSPTLMAHHICAVNHRQYNQALPPPPRFGKDTLNSYFGYNGNTAGAEDIIQGILPPGSIRNSLLPESNALLSTLTTFPHQICNVLPSIITPAAFQTLYQALDEKISSSPSGHHLGHYKVTSKSNLLTQIHSMMMSIPVLTATSPSRYRSLILIRETTSPLGDCLCLDHPGIAIVQY
jgi:hypothetical protein